MAKFSYPAISVIIPMYNVEKYIGECLNSLLAQTFQNFEVIVIDDCSTDSSRAIVENYVDKFDGRLQLFKSKKNSGSGTFPRNLGLSYSRGEYLYFMDNDDAITPTALEELYFNAKKFDADVVHCEKFYMVPEQFINNADFRKNLRPTNYLTGQKIFVKEPLIWKNNFEERIIFFNQRKLIWNYWVQLIRRDFIIKNSIKMAGIIADDMLFTICELCCAEKYVVIPSVIYFYRQRKDSLIHKNVDVSKHLNLWITMLKDGICYLDKFLDSLEFFSHRPDLKYLLLDIFSQEMLKYFLEIYNKIPAYTLDKLLRKELGDDTAFTSLIFSMMNIYRLQLMKIQNQLNQVVTKANQQVNQFNQFAAQAQKRIAELENELKRIRG